MTSVFSRFTRKRAGAEAASSQVDSTPSPSQSIQENGKEDPEIAVKGRSEGSDSEEKEKHAHTTVEEEESEEDLPDDVKEIPLIVRKIVSLEDDPTLPTITFRYFVLTIFFVAPGAVLYQMGLYRTTASAYPVLFVQIASHYCGLWLAKVLPAWEIRIPFTKWSFNLNPGPWSSKGKLEALFRNAMILTAGCRTCPGHCQCCFGSYLECGMECHLSGAALFQHSDPGCSMHLLHVGNRLLGLRHGCTSQTTTFIRSHLHLAILAYADICL